MKFLQRPLVKAVLKSIPFVGDVVDNLDSDTFESPKGSIDKKDLTTKIIRLGVLIILLYLVFSGKLTMEQATDAKDFISQ